MRIALIQLFEDQIQDKSNANSRKEKQERGDHNAHGIRVRVLKTNDKGQDDNTDDVVNNGST